MARLNPSYGSELHLLRMLGRHRNFFDREVRRTTCADAIEWLDFASGESHRNKNGITIWDREWQQLAFLPDGDVKSGWPQVWPAHRPGQNWDAVGRLSFGDRQEWLLVEAKANVEELRSSCQAADPSSKDLIRRTLEDTKRALGAPEQRDWLNGYYQYCNRLAVLHYLNHNRTPTHLLYVYFLGDVPGDGRTCPVTKAEWMDALSAQEVYVGLPKTNPLASHIHKIFVDTKARAFATNISAF